MKIRRSTHKQGGDQVKRVLRAVRAIESFRSDWFDNQDTTQKHVASTGMVVRSLRKKHERHLRYKPVDSEQGQTYRPAVVDTVNGAEEVLQLGDGDNVLHYEFGSDTPQEVGASGLGAMAERLEWLAKQMRRDPAACNIDGYSLRTPHRAP